MLLASCGGSDGGGAPVVTPTPTPTPSPTPVPGVVATMTTGNIPGLVADSSVNKAEASNQGLYLLVSSRLLNGRPADKIVKLQGDPSAASAWTTVLPEPEGSIADFAVANPYSEQNGDVDFYYIERNGLTTTPIGGTVQIWGRYSTIAGLSARSTVEITQGIQGPLRIAAGAPVGSTSQLSWIAVFSPSTGTYVIRRDTGTTSDADKLYTRFSHPASPSIAGPYIEDYSRLFANPTQSRLYSVIGQTLYVYDADSRLASYPLQDTLAKTDTMFFYDGALYFGYSDAVWRLGADGALVRLATKDTEENFCITGGDIYFAKGDAVNLQTTTRRNWISTGTLTASQSTQADNVRGVSPYRIYCSASAATPTIYSYLSGSQQIRVIKPLTS